MHSKGTNRTNRARTVAKRNLHIHPVSKGAVISMFCWQVVIGSFLAAHLGLATLLGRAERGLADWVQAG
jgi:hypothetical protein